MPRPKHYVPTIGRELVCVLYHEARLRGMPMTRLVNHLLTEALTGAQGWQMALMQQRQQQHPTSHPAEADKQPRP